MRLLSTKEKRLEFPEPTPPYAILSHTWGSDEVTLQDLQTLSACGDQSSKAAYRKIQACCDQAICDGYDWVWIDTCCIDKTSSAELSETINSMFRWYKESKVCYVYLEDVSSERELQDGPNAPDTDTKHEFRTSKWFTRGWTLQELLAPDEVRFFSKSWSLIGDRSSLRHLVNQITGIPPDFLMQRRLSKASIAQRMSWAANRKTSREEDIAYCLLGIFDVNMPLLYGEGSEKAFRRLQEEIIKQSDDQTIFAWGFNLSDRDNEETSILAESPSEFTGCKDVIPCKAWTPVQTTHFEITKKGLHIELPLLPSRGETFGLLNCRLTHDFTNLIAIPLGSGISRDGADFVVERFRNRSPILSRERTALRKAKLQTVYIRNIESAAALFTSNSSLPRAMIRGPQDHAFEALSVDASLNSIITEDHILVHGSDIETSHDSPIFRIAYFRYWTEGTPESPDRKDFLVKLEVSLKDVATRLFTKATGNKSANWKVHCFIAKAPGWPQFHSPTLGELETLEWSQSVISSHWKITAHIRKQTMIGIPMAIVTLRRIPLGRTHSLRILFNDCLRRFCKILLSVLVAMLLDPEIYVKNATMIEQIPRLGRFYARCFGGLICLFIGIFSILLPVQNSYGITAVVSLSAALWLALGIISTSACYSQSRPHHDGTFSYRGFYIFVVLFIAITSTIVIWRYYYFRNLETF
ncbi:heterokaryon incompatibility protein-domain-containing protein [Cadophora sp. MPI-SDFR-AT-0126]|nr:heterokaryon incompatibility protein-domain-containing protein [Leotiomycetes sp. MPI-SDFR-AT-0126]